MKKTTFDFWYTPDNFDEYSQEVHVSFTISEDHDIYDVHRLCKRFCQALGFADKCIEEAFGETVYRD